MWNWKQTETGVEWVGSETAKQLARYIDGNRDGKIADAARDARDDLMVVWDMLEDEANKSYRFLNKLLRLTRLLDEERDERPD